MLLTLLVCLVDATDLLGVARGQDLNQTALVRASSLREGRGEDGMSQWDQVHDNFYACLDK